MKVRELIERLKDLPEWMDVNVALSDRGEGEAVRVEERGGVVAIVTDVRIYDYQPCPDCGC